MCFDGSWQCVVHPILPITYKIDAEFIKYVILFEKEYESYKKKKINLNKISIVFSKALDDLDYAVCDKHYLETSGVIKVNPKNWNRLSSTEREIVIFH